MAQQRAKGKKTKGRNGDLKIPVAFDDAIRAALETKPENGRTKDGKKRT